MTQSKRIAILGAQGFLGGRLWREWSGTADLGLWGRRSFEPLPEWAQSSNCFEVDVTAADCFQSLIEWQPDLIVYAVSLDHAASESDPAEACRVNVTPYVALLTRLAEQDNPVRVIYLSTLHVVGLMKGSIDESASGQPASIYAWTHLACEQAGACFQSKNSKLQVVSVRLANGAGAPALKCDSCWMLALNDFCRQAWSTGKIVLNSDGAAVRNVLPLKDFTSALAKLIESPAPWSFSTCNLAGSESLSIRDLAERVARAVRTMSGQEIAISTKAEKQANAVTETELVIDCRRLNSIGWHASQTIESTIEEIFTCLESGQI